MQAYLEFEVSLKYTQPLVWRRFHLQEQATFGDLNDAIQDSFGWEREHLWEFRSGGRRPRTLCGMDTGFESPWADPVVDAYDVALGSYFKRANTKCIYAYDFGDGWLHEVKLQRRFESDESFWRRLIAGRLAGPPEDCGGVPGYEYLVWLMQAPRKELDEDDLERLEWLGEDWKPDGFDLELEKKAFEMLRPPGGRSFQLAAPLSPLQKKQRQQLPEEPTDSVVALFRDAMVFLGLNEAQINNAEQLWTDFVEKAGKNRRKAVTNAAGVVYCIATLDFTELTQQEVGEALGVSVTTVSKAYREMWAALELDKHRARYATVSSKWEARTNNSPLAALLQGIRGEPSLVVAPTLDEAVEQRLRVLPEWRVTWIFAVRLLPVPIEELGGVQPRVLVCFEATSHEILGVHFSISPAHDQPQEALDMLSATMLQPMIGEAHRPAHIQVDNPQLAEILGSVLAELDIDVAYEASGEQADALIGAMLDRLHAEDLAKLDEASYFSAPDVTPELVKQFHHAAARFAELAPWQEIDEGPHIAVELNRWGWERVCISITGAAGEACGVLFFRSASDFIAFQEFGKQSPEDLIGKGSMPDLTVLSMGYDSLEELGAARQKEVLTEGWEVIAPDRYPSIIHVSLRGGELEVNADTYRAVTACMEAIVGYIETHEFRFLELETPERVTIQVSGMALDVMAPHPDFKWG